MSLADRHKARTPTEDVQLKPDTTRGSRTRIIAAERAATADSLADEIRALLSRPIFATARRLARERGLRLAFSRATAIADSKPRSIGAASDLCLQKASFFDADRNPDPSHCLRYLADPFSKLRARRYTLGRPSSHIGLSGGRALAPNLTAAILEKEPTVVPAEDRRVLICSRPRPRGVGVIADAVELLYRVLRETAYAYELRGSRAAGARKSEKAARDIHAHRNRGYATSPHSITSSALSRDESNAAIDANRRRQPDEPAHAPRTGSRCVRGETWAADGRRPAPIASHRFAGSRRSRIADYQSGSDRIRRLAKEESNGFSTLRSHVRAIPYLSRRQNTVPDTRAVSGNAPRVKRVLPLRSTRAKIAPQMT